MSLAQVHTRALLGLTAPAVQVEVHVAAGLPSTQIVGLPEAAVREAKDRVRVALLSTGFDYPNRRMTIHLAPAELPKEGGRYDLAIALGILAASGQLPTEALHGCEFLGELSLSGELRPVPGILPALLAAADAGRRIIIPSHNQSEAALLDGAEIYLAEHLSAVTGSLRGEVSLSKPSPWASTAQTILAVPDLAEVRGQAMARRALEVAASGGHHMLFNGPPGSGKSMLATRLPGLLPPLQASERVEVAALHSLVGTSHTALVSNARPFRAPHHGASAVAMVGGGHPLRPGEISLAHHGVLFLDELPEFNRTVLESLREPLEAGSIVLARAAQRVSFPARFQCIAAMNPCPCGYAGDARCHCTPAQIRRYHGKLSGPLLDRLDLVVHVPGIVLSEWLSEPAKAAEASSTVRARVLAARTRALQRAGTLNAWLSVAATEADCKLSSADQTWLGQAMARLGLSARSYHRLLRVARSIADLEGCPGLCREHLAEALSYRWRGPSVR